MAIPILHFWEKYFTNPDEGLGSTYERFIINDVLFKAIKHYRIKSVLETPSFGFTGLSGINSLGIALKNIPVTINDSNEHRLDLIKSVWSEFNTDIKFDLVKDFNSLPYLDNSFDMSWNFSALWFVNDLNEFLLELSRVSRKVILIMVPNTTGLGYLHQKYTGSDDLKTLLNQEYIQPSNFINPLQKRGWKLMFDSLIDCPLWPDIGMSKEDFIKKIRIGRLPNVKCRMKNVKCKKGLSILDYYSEKDLNMRDRLLKLNHFERHAPSLFKKIWAHHHYYLFLNVK